MNCYKKMKLRVNSTSESEEAQKLLFALGYMWPGGRREVGYTNSPFLYANSNGYLSHGSLSEHYAAQRGTETTLAQLVGMSRVDVDVSPAVGWGADEMPVRIVGAGRHAQLNDEPASKPRRKIVQVMSMPNGANDHYLVALCDDGTVWHSPYLVGHAGRWQQVALEGMDA